MKKMTLIIGPKCQFQSISNELPRPTSKNKKTVKYDVSLKRFSKRLNRPKIQFYHWDRNVGM